MHRDRGRSARNSGVSAVAAAAFALLASVQALSTVRDRLSGASLAPYALVDGVSVTAG